MKVRGLRTRLCPKCKEVTPHRTLYAKTDTGGRCRWFQLYWICTICHSLNPVVLPCYKLLSVPTDLPSALSNRVVEALRNGPLDIDELLRDLRRRRTAKTPHVLDSDVAMVLAYLRYRGIIIEEVVDRTARALEVLKARPSKSKHLGPCPTESEQGMVRRSLVSLYSQRWTSVARDGEASSVHQRRFVPVGALCLSCQYYRINPDELIMQRLLTHT